VTELVSGEAVVLELRLAKVPSRALALAIDFLIQALCLVLVLIVLVTVSPVLDVSAAAAIALVAMVVILVGYPVTVETLSRGRSLGKAALGLRVVRDDGGPVRFRHALVRGLVGFFVDFWVFGLLGAVALISSLASSKGKRVGDMLAGTVVIRERVPEQAGLVPDMPPPLAQWASGLELSRLPPDLALAARQYLSRRHQLRPEIGEGMAQRLAADVSRYVGRDAPPGTPAWAYLAAVVAERRNREMSRLMAQRPGPGQYLPAPQPSQPQPGPPQPGQPATPPVQQPSGQRDPDLRPEMPATKDPGRDEVPATTNDGFAPPR
jgi:uncharacterized RDD family membrane protein YckC